MPTQNKTPTTSPSIIRRFSTVSSTSSPIITPSISPLLKHPNVKRLRLNDNNGHNDNNDSNNDNDINDNSIDNIHNDINNNNNNNNSNNDKNDNDNNNNDHNDTSDSDSDNDNNNNNNENIKLPLLENKNNSIKNQIINDTTTNKNSTNEMNKKDEKNEQNITGIINDKEIIENGIDNVINIHKIKDSPVTSSPLKIPKISNIVPMEVKIDRREKEINKDKGREVNQEKQKITPEKYNANISLEEKAYKLICLRLAISCSISLRENEKCLIVNEDSNSRCSRNVPLPIAEQILQLFKLNDLISSSYTSLPLSILLSPVRFSNMYSTDTLQNSKDDDVANSSRTFHTSRSESRSGSVTLPYLTVQSHVHDDNKNNSEYLKFLLSIMKTLHLLAVRSWDHTDILPNRLFKNKISNSDLTILRY